MKKTNVVPSQETQKEAMNIAKATQKPGQTKEQTKLIAQGIEKGIALYKKQQKQKAREADKDKKKRQKQQAENSQPDLTQPQQEPEQNKSQSASRLAWILLIVSWIGFALYILTIQKP